MPVFQRDCRIGTPHGQACQRGSRYNTEHSQCGVKALLESVWVKGLTDAFRTRLSLFVRCHYAFIRVAGALRMTIITIMGKSYDSAPY